MIKYKIHIGVAAGSFLWLLSNSISAIEIAQELYSDGEMAAIDAFQSFLFLLIPITAFSLVVGCIVVAAITDFIEGE